MLSFLYVISMAVAFTNMFNGSLTPFYIKYIIALFWIAIWVIDIIKKYTPSLIITLHAPYKVVNYDGPAEIQAQKISQIINYPVEASIGYPTPGSFGTYCGIERNIPTITLELDEKIPVEKLIPPVFEIFNLF